ncbi:insulysin [Rhizoctonia solani AG-1 IB]|uniref:Insulysin n=1 Tax=Thanatephorus cucumeris (strain AG1-IB / isolate 7/3/14) TaxID=1108050 RepID=A0A0B7G5N0_THACB|nr:insulysin [Rhizoctonia solani AG-1 IB]
MAGLNSSTLQPNDLWESLHNPADWHTVPASADQPGYSVFKKDIRKPEVDDRHYRCIKLENDLEVLLIHDPNADKSAASLDVEIGHLHDPDDLPGLAHFCEHLSFMGTEQFPKENAYSEFITSNGGSTNAFTSAHNTNYYFNVGSKSLPGALSRFAGFFHSPLFSEACTSRELNAVDSENKKNRQNDVWRIHQLNKSLSKPGHPWAKFGTGNRETLTAASRKKTHPELLPPIASDSSAISQAPSPSPSEVENNETGDGGAAGRETRRRLVEWWEAQYSAERMKLVVLGTESLDDLTNMVVREFSAVKNRGLGRTPLMLEDPRGTEHNGIIVYAKTVMDFRALEVSWSCEWQNPQYLTKPATILGHLLGHEGPGSIHAYLKNKGWISYLSAGIHGGGRGFSFFKITTVLTKDGMDHHKEVLLTLYRYLEYLKASSLPAYIHEENKIIAESRFRFAEKRSAEKYVSSLSERLSGPYPRDLALCAEQLVWEWDEPALRSLLNSFTVERSRVMIMAKEGLPEGAWVNEKWYGTEYWTEAIPAALIEEAKMLDDFHGMYIPKPNEFIPKNFDVERATVETPSKKPIKLRNTELSTIWHKKDDQFWIPRARIILRLLNPICNATPRHSLLSRMFVDLVKDTLTEFTYDAELAGMKYSIMCDGPSIVVVSEGYNDKLSVLMEHVLEKVKSIIITEDRVTVIAEQLQQEIENFYLTQPYTLSNYYADHFLRETGWTPKQKLAELDYVTLNDIQHHAQELLARTHITMLIHGNIGSEESLRIGSRIESILGSRPITAAEKSLPRSLTLPKGSNYVWEDPVPNKEELNSSLTYYVEVGDLTNAPLRATLLLFAQMIREPAFNQLRTKEQLGYVVSSSAWFLHGSIGWHITVQSERKPVYLERRVESFLDLFKETLKAMPEVEFERQRDAFALKRLERLKNMGEEASRFWAHIESGYQDFLRRETDAKNVRLLTKQDIETFFNTHVHHESPMRRKLSIHLASQKQAPSKFSVAASEALLDVLKQEGVPVDEDQYRQLSAPEPPLDAVVEFWTKHLESHPSSSSILSRIPDISAQHPTTSFAEESTLPESVVRIDDIAVFKAHMTASKAPTPIIS